MEHPEQVNVEAMEQMLRSVEKDNTITVVPDIEVDELNKDLHGGSCMSRVTVRYTRGEEKTYHSQVIIIKVLPKRHSMTGIIDESTNFPREIQMFQMILPKMHSLLFQAFPDRHKEFSAQVYYTQESPTYLIAIEDLAPKGFKPPERKDGLNLELCLLTLRTIARFHAASVIMHLEDKSLFKIFDKYCFLEEGARKFFLPIIKNISPVIITAIETSPEFGHAWAERLRRRYQTLYEDMSVIWMRDENSFNVLNHGDFGLHNVMFRYSESNEVDGIMLVDFQCCSYNSPVLDLIQFIFSSATDDVRVNHTDRLLKEYHAELVVTLESLGAPKTQIVSLPQLLQEFDNKILYGVFYILLVLPLLNLRPECGLTMEDLLMETGFPTNEFTSILLDDYLDILKRWLLIFEQKNII